MHFYFCLSVVLLYSIKDKNNVESRTELSRVEKTRAQWCFSVCNLFIFFLLELPNYCLPSEKASCFDNIHVFSPLKEKEIVFQFYENLRHSTEMNHLVTLNVRSCASTS